MGPRRTSGLTAAADVFSSCCPSRSATKTHASATPVRVWTASFSKASRLSASKAGSVRGSRRPQCICRVARQLRQRPIARCKAGSSVGLRSSFGPSSKRLRQSARSAATPRLRRAERASCRRSSARIQSQSSATWQLPGLFSKDRRPKWRHARPMPNCAPSYAREALIARVRPFRPSRLLAGDHKRVSAEFLHCQADWGDRVHAFTL